MANTTTNGRTIDCEEDGLQVRDLEREERRERRRFERRDRVSNIAYSQITARVYELRATIARADDMTSGRDVSEKSEPSFWEGRGSLGLGKGGM